jgi:hypothetical protein
MSVSWRRIVSSVLKDAALLAWMALLVEIRCLGQQAVWHAVVPNPEARGMFVLVSPN